MAKTRRLVRGVSHVIGIDEVGRGPLAGPVVVAAVALPFGLRIARRGLRDSKRLSRAAREEWARYAESHPDISRGLAAVSPRVIDRMNISKAANLAALRAARKLAARAGIELEQCEIYLDGGLYLGNGKARLAARTVIKGDEKIPAVSLASILAKTRRDRMMARYSRRFPGYGLDVHKGYGTRAHLAALRRIGPSPIHRLTFLKKLNNIDRKLHGRRTNKTSYPR